MIGRFSLSRFHGAQTTAISLQSHLFCDAKFKVFSNQSGV
jgi:hypothetical protein